MLTALLVVLAQQPSVAALDDRGIYIKATQLITSRQFGEANALLNELAVRQPKWGELYAARCSAQLGLQHPQYAVADCEYALKLKPELANARYGLATAQAQLGKTADAAAEFRAFAAMPSADPTLRAEALRKADALTPVAAAEVPPPPAIPPPAPRDDSARFTFNINADPRYAPGYAPGYVVPGPGYRRVEPAANACHSSIDCGSGGWCKDRGDGVHVCMNNGSHGDSCQSSIDCGSGGWCKDRGDGMKVCMSHGGPGAACQSSIDCGSGMWCKDPGNGMNVCMR